MSAFFAKDWDFSLLQMSYNTIVSRLVGKRQRTVVGFSFDAEVLIGVVVDAHNSLSGIKSSIDCNLEELFHTAKASLRPIL
jgi:hypothetical protein